MNKFVALVMRNLPSCLAVFFILKDMFAFRFLATREFGYENEFIARLALLPGSALFWGYGAWLIPFVNIPFAGFLGWLVSKKDREAKLPPGAD
jgi:hypothetical protein